MSYEVKGDGNSFVPGRPNNPVLIPRPREVKIQPFLPEIRNCLSSGRDSITGKPGDVTDDVHNHRHGIDETSQVGLVNVIVSNRFLRVFPEPRLVGHGHDAGGYGGLGGHPQKVSETSHLHEQRKVTG